MTKTWKNLITSFDDRRDLLIPGDTKETLEFCAEHFVISADEAIAARDVFTVALSGGSTPKAIYQLLATQKFKSKVDWSKVKFFWSDERCVPPSDLESNYHMAMAAGLASLPIPKNQIFRMPADKSDLNAAALAYEEVILKHVKDGIFDLVMLGMGEDGHTASLFPKTHGLHPGERLAIANYIPQKETWRMSLTFECINQAHSIVIYVIGKSKASMLKRVLTSPFEPDVLPIQNVGTRTHKALWIADNEAASALVPGII